MAIKEKVALKKLLGKYCLMASVFLNLRERLSSKGVDVTDLRRSSEAAPYLEKYFSPVVEEGTLTGVRVFGTIKLKSSRFVNPGLAVDEGSIFKDVVKRICEANKLS